jgi:hypothetical protein
MKNEMSDLVELQNLYFDAVKMAARISYLQFLGKKNVPNQDYKLIGALREEISSLSTKMREYQRDIAFLVSQNPSHSQVRQIDIAFRNLIDQMQSDSSSISKPFKRSYWIIPGVILAGEIPSALDDAERSKKISGLFQSGVNSIVNLTEKGESNFAGQQLIDYTQEVSSHALNNHKTITINRFAIKDLNVPSPLFMRAIQEHLTTEIQSGNTVYVHCWGGVGRTGTVVGSFLLQHGICTPDEVISFIKFLKKDTDIAHRDSPETQEQREFLVNWTSNFNHKNNQ